MRVKCLPDGELPAERRALPAVHMSHPAASEDLNPISPVAVRDSAKEVFFYEKITCFDF